VTRIPYTFRRSGIYVFYISGPQAMVAAERRLLRQMGVRFWRIRIDLFPGLA